jgi:hypothetical protein
MTSISATSATSAPTNPVAAARAQYLKTGIDKDAAAGDPDHDAGPKKVSAPVSKSGTVPASPRTAIASAVPTLNGAGHAGAASPALASAAYSARR